MAGVVAAVFEDPLVAGTLVPIGRGRSGCVSRLRVGSSLVGIGRDDLVFAREVQNARDQTAVFAGVSLRFIELAAADQVARHLGCEWDHIRTRFAAELQNDLAEEAAFFEGPAFCIDRLINAEMGVFAADDAASFDLRSVGRGQRDEHFGLAVLGHVRVDDLDGQRSFKRDLGNFLAVLRVGFLEVHGLRGSVLLRVAGDDACFDDPNLRGRRLVDVHD